MKDKIIQVKFEDLDGDIVRLSDDKGNQYTTQSISLKSFCNNVSELTTKERVSDDKTRGKLTKIFNAAKKELSNNIDLNNTKWRLKQVAFSEDGTMVAIVTKYFDLGSIEHHIGISWENVFKGAGLMQPNVDW